MALDKWNITAIAQEEAYRAIQQYKIEEKIQASMQEELDVKIKQEIDKQFAEMREAVKIMNEQILILKNAMEIFVKKHNK